MQGRDGFGIADGWWSIDGHWNEASQTSRAALRDRFGGDEHPDGPPDGLPDSPSVWFLHPGDDRSVWSPGVLALDAGSTLDVVDPLPDGLPYVAREYLRTTGMPPSWVDWDEMEKARLFFVDNNVHISTGRSS